MSPSSMTRILICPGSAVDNPPDRGSAAADVGTFAHTLCERLLRGESVDDSEYHDDDMRKAVFIYVAYVRAHKSHDELADVNHRNSVLYIEERIVSETNPEHGGTIDALIVSDNHIHVNDYKNGTYAVSPVDNDQILSYLVVANEKYPGRKRFFGSIIQPNVWGDIQCVEYTLDQILAHETDVLLATNDDELVAGEHCKWCPLKMSCVALAAKQKELAQISFEDINSDEWDGEKCKEVMAWGEVFAELVKESKRHLHKILMDGGEVEGWRLARSLGNRAWKDEEKVVELLGAKLKDKLYVQKILSPAQLEKFSKAYIPVVKELTHRPEKGIIAVLEDSKLPIYDPKDLFEDIKE